MCFNTISYYALTTSFWEKCVKIFHCLATLSRFCLPACPGAPAPAGLTDWVLCRLGHQLHLLSLLIALFLCLGLLEFSRFSFKLRVVLCHSENITSRIFIIVRGKPSQLSVYALLLSPSNSNFFLRRWKFQLLASLILFFYIFLIFNLLFCSNLLDSPLIFLWLFCTLFYKST